MLHNPYKIVKMFEQELHQNGQREREIGKI